MPEIILTKKSKKRFSGYKTTIFSNSGLKVNDPGLKKVLWNRSKVKSKLKLDKTKNAAASNTVNKDPIIKIINNFLKIFLKLYFISTINKINKIKNKIMEK